MSRHHGRADPVWRDIIPARLSFMIAVLLAPVAACAGEAPPADWADVKAIFDARCVMCHSRLAGASKGLRLDDYDALLAGSERGAVLVAGNVADSELVRRLRGASTPRMPFLSRPLPEDQIELIEVWILAGMPNRNRDR